MPKCKYPSYVWVDGKNNRFEAHLSYSVEKGRGKAKGLYFAQCLEFNYIARGNCLKEAVENLILLIEDALEDAIEKNVLEGVLKECGFSKKRLPLCDRTLYVKKSNDNLYPLEIEFLLSPQ